MITARPWLPAGAVRDDALSVALGALGETWARRWFMRPKPVAMKMNTVRDRTVLASESVCWSLPSRDFVVALAPAAHVPIASAMLGLETGAQKIAAQDLRVLRELAMLCARDLATEIARFFGMDGPLELSSEREARGQLRFALAMGGATQLIELIVGETDAIGARKMLLPAPPAAPTELQPRSDALARQHIHVGAMIGRGKLDLGELKALAPGDVIVLDRGPSDMLALAINGDTRTSTPCSIVQAGETLKMRIGTLQAGGMA